MEITGIKLESPLILAAGILGSTGASLRRVACAGAGAVVTKSLGLVPREGYRNPCVVELEDGFINAVGLQNPSYRNFMDEIEITREANVPIVASIFGGRPEEFAEIATAMSGDVDGFELNLSCPHAEGYGAEIGSDPMIVEEVTRSVKSATDLPVWVKLTPNVRDIATIGLAAERGGADAVVAINTLRAMAIDVESGYPILSNRFGGLSGAPIKPVAVRAVYELYQALKIPIIGVGGISSWEDAVEMMMAGASAVEIGSAVYRGLNIFKEIGDGISRYLKRKDMRLGEIVGIAHSEKPTKMPESKHSIKRKVEK
ncbi:MAG: dihydroorotate dehydrogenase [Methanosarcinales archaeon]